MERTPRAAPWLMLCWVLSAAAVAACSGSTIPHALSDREWWGLIETLSEAPGAFELSDNFVSNEPDPAERARWLVGSGGAYIGVGPEQNFTYVAAARPDIAFVLDIRRENLALHLLYKALFELSGDRAEFVSQLFSRPRPAGVARDSGVDELFRTFERVPRSFAELAATRSRVHVSSDNASPLAASGGP